MVDALECSSGDVEPTGLGSGGEHEIVPRNPTAAREVEKAVGIDALDALAGEDLDVMGVVPLLGQRRRALGSTTLGEIALGERRALVGQVWLSGDHPHLPVITLVPQRFCCLRRGQSATDDDSLPARRHARAHGSACWFRIGGSGGRGHGSSWSG